ncbi:Hypothetical Protein FCC1311_023192 [Hondaea fermentalgiana]|uniref:Uncharacterized protein n=1 Tax=Hondaea fermentalgiana TaxID=2315210 RepID=A0A2R5G704_9STRA|nr:Hypothetical Protein FCC1311_023192 [Hondaea fermentalgiana]|eukprot:GBG26099.1 Hypothetical Protein FCC1311_023192 [Hondaea fermentalgiana]
MRSAFGVIAVVFVIGFVRSKLAAALKRLRIRDRTQPPMIIVFIAIVDIFKAQDGSVVKLRCFKSCWDSKDVFCELSSIISRNRYPLVTLSAVTNAVLRRGLWGQAFADEPLEWALSARVLRAHCSACGPRDLRKASEPSQGLDNLDKHLAALGFTENFTSRSLTTMKERY